MHKHTHTCSFFISIKIFEIKCWKKNHFIWLQLPMFISKETIWSNTWAMNYYQNYVLPAVLISSKGFHLFKWEKGANLLEEERRESSFKIWDFACHTDATFHEDGLCVSLLSSPLPVDWWLSAVNCRGASKRVWVQRQDKENAVTPNWREMDLPGVFIWMDLQIGAGREVKRAIRNQVRKHKEIIIKWAILRSASGKEEL